MKTFRGCCIITLFGLLTSLASAQVVFQFDYSTDSGGFFGTQQKATLSAAASYLSSFLTGQTLSAISPTWNGSTGTQWTSTQPNPATGSSFTLGTLGAGGSAGPSIAANTIVIYVGARDLSGSQIAYGEQAAWSYGSGWSSSVINARGDTVLMPKIGSIAFDSLAPWYFDSNISTVETFSSQYDFFSVAVHEMVHLLGQFYNTSTVGTYSYGWAGKVSGSNFIGTNAVAEFGGNIPLTADKAHWAEGTMSYIAGTIPVANIAQEALMDPTFNYNVRKYLTELDFAALQDMGFAMNQSTMLVNVSAVPEPSGVALCFGAGVLAWVGWSRRRARQVKSIPLASGVTGRFVAKRF